MAVLGISIEPIEPIVARDGRPFGRGQGDRMRSLGWPYPSTVAGAFRTLLGKLSGTEFPEEVVEELKRISVHGPLPLYNGKLFFPQPEDFMDLQENTMDKGEHTAIKLWPKQYDQKAPGECPGEGCDLPSGLLPCFPSPDKGLKKKKDRKNTFWDIDLMADWLLDTDLKAPFSYHKSHTLSYPEIEERMHVRIDPKTGLAAEGELFATAHLDMTVKCAASHENRLERLILAAKVDAGEKNSLSGYLEDVRKKAMLHPLGGERRLCIWSGEDDALFRCPDKLKEASEKMESNKGTIPIRLRMILATPAIFTDGWKPGWLHEERTTHTTTTTTSLIGTPPGMPDLKLKLISASIPRWRAVSGYSLEKGRGGPKPVRRVVPAGAVYFFEVVSGKVDLGSLWLRPVCDNEQDSRDGFGLAVWGLWRID